MACTDKSDKCQFPETEKDLDTHTNIDHEKEPTTEQNFRDTGVENQLQPNDDNKAPAESLSNLLDQTPAPAPETKTEEPISKPSSVNYKLVKKKKNGKKKKNQKETENSKLSNTLAELETKSLSTSQAEKDSTREDEKESKTTIECDENKEQNEEDFSIFDEFDKKISKSMKKKLKRKTKMQVAQAGTETEENQTDPSKASSNNDQPVEEIKELQLELLPSTQENNSANHDSTTDDELKTTLPKKEEEQFVENVPKNKKLVTNASTITTDLQNDDIGFIEVKGKKKPAKPIKEPSNDRKKRKDKSSYQSTKTERTEYEVKTAKVYEVKKKPESKKTEAVNSQNTPQSNQNNKKVPLLGISNLNETTSQKKSKSGNSPNTSESETSTRSSSHKSHPLSISSPSIDIDSLKIMKVKHLAEEFFEKKFKKDIYSHVAKVTEDSNKMMAYRILAYKRIEYCLKKIFPSNLSFQYSLFN